MLEAVNILETCNCSLQRALILPFRSNPHKCRGPTSKIKLPRLDSVLLLYFDSKTQTQQLCQARTQSLCYMILYREQLPHVHCLIAHTDNTLLSRPWVGETPCVSSNDLSWFPAAKTRGSRIQRDYTDIIHCISWETVLSRYVYSLLHRIPSSSSLTIFHLHQHWSFSNEIKMHGTWTSIYSLQLWAICFR